MAMQYSGIGMKTVWISNSRKVSGISGKMTMVKGWRSPRGATLSLKNDIRSIKIYLKNKYFNPTKYPIYAIAAPPAAALGTWRRVFQKSRISENFRATYAAWPGPVMSPKVRHPQPGFGSKNRIHRGDIFFASTCSNKSRFTCEKNHNFGFNLGSVPGDHSCMREGLTSI